MAEPSGSSKTGQRGMGRGLAALLASGPGAGADGPALRDLAIELIRPNPNQPRREFDGETLLALSESIKQRGILQPLVVRPLPGGSYELIAGERRLRAAKLAGLEQVPAIVRATEEGERLELALIENMAREDLNPIDEARACATLVDDLGVTKEEVGRRVGRSRVAISNAIRLLDLPDEVQSMIQSGELSAGHGRALLLCKDHSERRRLAREARDRAWSVRETERHAKEEHGRLSEPRGGRQVVIHPDLADLLASAEDALGEALGREVKVTPKGNRYKVEFVLDDAREAAQLAARIAGRQRTRAA
ncbi:MAG TPA: ParB/RepB/Spo0J family partition protein [Thermoleophilaceae bacterium]|nr:ParB/RepB/Spo0J family partition protein [Thermoleophilaceae bacterium]